MGRQDSLTLLLTDAVNGQLLLGLTGQHLLFHLLFLNLAFP